MKNDDNAVVNEEDPQNLPTIGGVRLVNEPVAPHEEPQTVINDPDSNGTSNGGDNLDTGDWVTNDPDSNGTPRIVYHMNMIGIITIIFGIFVGVYLLVQFSQPVQMFFAQSDGELTFDEVVVAFGAAMIFIVPGVICIGIGKIIKLLDT
ncbi:hypothetical protein C6499_21775 [Candidatus Poribacteria bacterium]|nr:MAG: hypothetical protein C6499_21775 [Candidatus Poribacteria bacterium]